MEKQLLHHQWTLWLQSGSRLAVSYIESTVPCMRTENSYMAWLLLASCASLKTVASQWESNWGTSDQPSPMVYARPLPQCNKCVLLTSSCDCEVTGGWHLRKVHSFLKDHIDQTDRKKKLKEEERRKTGQCRFIKLYFRELD